LLVGAVGVAGSPLAAPRKEQAKGEFERAQIQYKLGHFQEALEGYSRAYELFPAPAFLFNIGQCHKNLKHYERALFFFEGYLREEKTPAKRALAMELVAESKVELEKQTSRPAQPDPTPGVASPRPDPDQPPARPSSPILTPPAAGPAVAAQAIAQAKPDDGRAEKSVPITHAWWFWTAIGAGVLAVAGGLVYARSGNTTLVPPSGSIGTLDRR
jgi:tetratricopeptide (TPR) repeat protein